MLLFKLLLQIYGKISTGDGEEGEIWKWSTPVSLKQQIKG